MLNLWSRKIIMLFYEAFVYTGKSRLMFHNL